MALTTLGTLASLVLLQTGVSAPGEEGAAYGQPGQCSNEVIGGIWGSLPACTPRDEMVRLPLPDDPDVVEVIPSHVSTKRCSGVCHRGNLYHKCVPGKEGNSTSTASHAVMLRRHSGAVECGVVQVETHEKCECGCDTDASACNAKQVSESTRDGVNHTITPLIADVRRRLLQVPVRRRRPAIRLHARVQGQKDVGRGELPVRVPRGGVPRVQHGLRLRCPGHVPVREPLRNVYSSGYVFVTYQLSYHYHGDGQYLPASFCSCRCVRETTMSLAGVEMVIALVVVIVILAAALGGTCWKLYSQSQHEQAQVQAAIAARQEREPLSQVTA